MRMRFFLVVLGLTVPGAAGLAAGCGPSVETTPGTGGAGLGGFGGGQGVNGSVGPGGFDAGADVLPDYVDPGCPDAGPPMTMFSCDPYNQNNGDCSLGDGCFIFVQYPQGPCGQEVYGATCQPAGSGTQGAPCQGAQACAGGFVCVVSGSGNQCVQLCELQGNSGCTDGLVCEPIDVEGFGGCL
jgi:hypothetical protein